MTNKWEHQAKLFDEDYETEDIVPQFGMGETKVTVEVKKKEYDPSIKQLCLHNEKDICFYLASAPYPCKDLCNGFKSSNAVLRTRINKRLRGTDKIKINDWVTMWHINKAYNIYSDDDSIQGKLRE